MHGCNLPVISQAISSAQPYVRHRTTRSARAAHHVAMKPVPKGEVNTPVLEHADEDEQSWLSRLGPGLITGAADDDPSGIAT